MRAAVGEGRTKAVLYYRVLRSTKKLSGLNSQKINIPRLRFHGSWLQVDYSKDCFALDRGVHHKKGDGTVVGGSTL